MTLLSGCAAPQERQSGLPPAIADPDFLVQFAETSGFTLGLPVQIKWVPDGSAALFLRSPPRSFVRDLYEYDVASAQERRLLTAEQILAGAEEKLSAEEKARRERQRSTARGIASFDLSKDGARILVNLSGRLFWIERKTLKVNELTGSKGFPLDARFSPDGKQLACVRDGDLYVYDLASGRERRLTRKAGENLSNGVSEFIAQEEMSRHEGYWWSPDNRRLLYQRTDSSGLERMHIADAAHPDQPAQSWPYPRPGKANAVVRLGVMPAAGGKTIWAQWDAEKYPYLATVRWDKNSPPVLLVQNRRQTEELLLELNPATGQTHTLLAEQDAAWLNLDQDMPRWLPDGKSFLWTTERNGAWELELRARDGKLLRALFGPPFGYRGLVSVDEAGSEALVYASINPTEQQAWRVPLNGARAAPELLTSGSGWHVLDIAENHSRYVHARGSPAGRSDFEVHQRDGTLIGKLTSVAETPPFVPNLEYTAVGEAGFHAVIVRPRNFDPKRRYPVLEFVYGGPGVTRVQVSAYTYLLQQWMADHGFIVVTVDTRGTPFRGRDWERSIRGNFIELPLADHVAALQALTARYGEMDAGRIGVWGWSFGGYFSAMAVMQRPDVYRAAVAGAPVSEWTLYDTHYTERYLGLPQDNAAGYRASSVLTYANKLSRPLLIVHGTTDDNVYFAHALQLSDALLRAGRPFEFLPLSNFTHMVAEPQVRRNLNQQIIGFFQRELAP